MVEQVARGLILAGVLLLLAGVLLLLGDKLGLGRLPGDLVFRKGGFTLFLPLASGLVISIVLTVLLWMFKR